VKYSIIISDEVFSAYQQILLVMLPIGSHVAALLNVGSSSMVLTWYSMGINLV